MKALVKICIYLTALFFLLKGLDFIYEFGLRHNANLKADYVVANKVDAKIVFHGPCEPLWMLDPARIDTKTKKPSYNLALSHSDFADNYLHLYLYLKNNKAPKYLFLYVTPESMDKKFNTFNTYRFAEFVDDSLVSSVVKENDPAYFQWSRIPFMRFAYYNSNIMFNALQGCKHYKEDRRTPYYANGFEPPAKIVWDNHLEDMRKQYPNGYTFIADSLRIKYLDKTIQLAQSHGTKVILYESPVFKESIASVTNRDEMIKMIRTIAGRNNVQYVQFDDLPLADSREYFISSLNLNMKGIEVFNDTLANYISRMP